MSLIRQLSIYVSPWHGHGMYAHANTNAISRAIIAHLCFAAMCKRYVSCTSQKTSVSFKPAGLSRASAALERWACITPCPQLKSAWHVYMSRWVVAPHWQWALLQGVIDFGDLAHTFLVNELAILIAYMMMLASTVDKFDAAQAVLVRSP